MRGWRKMVGILIEFKLLHMREKQGVRFHLIRDFKQYYYFNSIPPTSQ